MTECDMPGVTDGDRVSAASVTEASATVTPTDDVDAGLAEHFVALADSLFAATPDGVMAVVECIVGAACAIVNGADVVSIVLREPDGRFATVSDNHEAAVHADQLQNELGEGPSLSAADRDGVGAALADDLGSDTDWPAFGPRAADELGLRAALSTGMFPGGDPPRFGALNFYSRTPHAFDQDARDHALILAAYAAAAISAVQGRTAGELREAQLAEALRSRDVIGQAKGILMERRGQTADEAFAVLQRASQDLNIKLRDVAQTLVSHRDEI